MLGEEGSYCRTMVFLSSVQVDLQYGACRRRQRSVGGGSSPTARQRLLPGKFCVRCMLTQALRKGAGQQALLTPGRCAALRTAAEKQQLDTSAPPASARCQRRSLCRRAPSSPCPCSRTQLNNQAAGSVQRAGWKGVSKAGTCLSSDLSDSDSSAFRSEGTMPAPSYYRAKAKARHHVSSAGTVGNSGIITIYQALPLAAMPTTGSELLNVSLARLLGALRRKIAASAETHGPALLVFAASCTALQWLARLDSTDLPGTGSATCVRTAQD